MLYKTLAAFAAAAAAFAVGTPVASAAVNDRWVSVNKTPEQVVFTVEAPDGDEQLGLFVDTDGVETDADSEDDGDFFSSDVVLLVGTGGVQYLKTSDSSRYCQRIGGTDPVELAGAEVASSGDGSLTVTVPTAELHAAFDVAGSFVVAGRSFTEEDSHPVASEDPDDPADCAVDFLNFPMSSYITHVGAVYAPQAPTGLTGVAGNGQVTVSWNAATDAGEYAL